MEQKQTVKVERVKHPAFKIRFFNDNTNKYEDYNFPEYNPKNPKPRIKEISIECYYELIGRRKTFSNGSLVICKDNEEEVIEEVMSIDGYSENAHTREDVEKLLKGNVKRLKEELEKITNVIEKQLFIEVAKEIKLDNYTKQKALVDAIFEEGVTVEDVFEVQE